MLKSGLSLYCAQVTTNGTFGAVQEYAEQVESLTFTTVSPGGCGQLTATLKVADARLPRPELNIMSLIAIMAQNTGIWVGEITDTDIGHTDADGDSIAITALGVGNGLRDHPLSVIYTAQTAQQIVTDQLSRLSTFNLPVDQDTTAIFPDNPGTTYTVTHQSRTMEEVMSDTAILAGNYAWGTWPHPLATQPVNSHKGTQGFPLGQVQVHVRDSATTHYQAALSLAECYEYHIQPSAERAYNYIAISYASNGTVGTATYTDTRLSGGAGIGTAPFRRRDYVRDLSGTSIIGATQAQAIANTYGALFQNVTNKVDLYLKGVRDSNGSPLDLWRVQADRNIFVPEMAVRGQQLPKSAVAGTNQFYIVQTTYTEDQNGIPQLECQCDNFVDNANVIIARLQLQQDALSRQGAKTTGMVQVSGASDVGFYGVDGQTSGSAQSVGEGVNYHTTMTNTPTSVTLSVLSHSNDATTTVSNVDVLGFSVVCTSTASGRVFSYGHYTTHGN